jgi:hypothetical protein
MTGTLETLSRQCALGRPCIAVYRDRRGMNHSVVVLDVVAGLAGERGVVVMDPAEGAVRTRSAEWFESRWRPLKSPVLLVARRAEAEEGT